MGPAAVSHARFLLPTIGEPGADALERPEPFDYLRAPPSDRLRPSLTGCGNSGQFRRLYDGFEAGGLHKLVQRADNPDRSPGVDMTFSVEQSVSSLWAIGDPEMRERIEAMAVA